MGSTKWLLMVLFSLQSAPESTSERLPSVRLTVLRGHFKYFDLFSNGDPYVDIFLNNDYIGSTSSVTNSLRPYWNKDFRLKDVDTNSFLFFSVMDSDFFTPPDIIKIFAIRFFQALDSNGQSFFIRDPETDNYIVIRLTWASSSECGLLMPSAKQSRYPIKIRGGVPANNGVPWQVSLQSKKARVVNSLNGEQEDEFEHFCGGSVINSRYILTAGHCVNRRDISNFTIFLGSDDLSSLSGQRLRVEQIKVNPSYSHKTLAHDVALLRTRGKIVFNQAVSDICLPIPGVKYVNSAVASGWGHKRAPYYSEQLRKVNLDIVTDDKCHELLAGSETRHFFSSRHMICAQGKDHDSDTTDGDSGGPLFVEHNERYHILGVTSWGPQSHSRGYPGSYSDVAYDLAWIENNANDFD